MDEMVTEKNGNVVNSTRAGYLRSKVGVVFNIECEVMMHLPSGWAL